MQGYLAGVIHIISASKASKPSLPRHHLRLHLKIMTSHSQPYLLLLLTLIVASFAQPNTPSDAPSSNEATHNSVLLAHAIVYGIAFALIFPFGALLLRFFPSRSRDFLWYHAALQILGVVFMFVGFGLGGWLCSTFPPVSTLFLADGGEGDGRE
jgi:purine-cytosine permease-like protein